MFTKMASCSLLESEFMCMCYTCTC